MYTSRQVNTINSIFQSSFFFDIFDIFAFLRVPPCSSRFDHYHSYNYSNYRPNLCDIETKFWENPLVLKDLYGRFDPTIGVNSDGSVPANGETLNSGWHDVSGYNRKFIKNNIAATYAMSGINDLPTVQFSQPAAMYLDKAFDAANYGLYVVGRRSSSTGRLVSSYYNRNWILGWWNRFIGVAHLHGGWCGSHTSSQTNAHLDPKIVSVRAVNKNSGKFYVDGDLAATCTNNKAWPPGKLQLGGWRSSRNEPAAGDFGTILLYTPQPSDEVHDMLTAYLAWKWKPVETMSTREKELLQAGINIGSKFCRLELPQTSNTGDPVSVASGNAATKDTKFLESPQSIPLSQLANIALTSCNRFGCSPPAIVRVEPPPAPTISSLRVVETSNEEDALRIVFQKPTETRGAEVTFYLLSLFKTDSLNPFRVDRIDDLATAVTYDLLVGVEGSESGEWLSDTDPKLVGLTVEMVSCSVLNCTETPATMSTSSPDLPFSVVVRRDSSMATKITVNVTNPIFDGGVEVSEFKVEWQAFWNCYDLCESFADLTNGDILAAGALEVSESPTSGTLFTPRSSGTGTFVTIQLAVVEWTMTIDNVYIGEKEHVTVTQGTSVGTLKTNLGTTCTVEMPSTAINESQYVLISQGINTGKLHSALTGAATSFIINVEPGTVFDAASEIMVGATPVSATTVECEKTTSLVIVAKVGVSFETGTELVVGTTAVETSKITNAVSANSNLPSSLRLKVIVIACNTIGCGNGFTTWNVDLATSISYEPSYTQAFPLLGKIPLQINWDTSSESSLTSAEVANPLSTLFHVTVPYTTEMSTTLRRTTAWVFNASKPDYVSGNIVVGKDGIQKEINSEQEGTVVYEVMALEKGEYALHVLCKCPDDAHNKWNVVFNGNQPTIWSLPVDENDAGQWAVFPDYTWDIQAPGEKIWVELQSNHDGCLISSLQVGKIKPPYSRQRIWPPKINTPIMQEYIIAPYGNTKNVTIDNSCIDSQIRNDLCGVRSVLGILPLQLLGRHCLLNVNVPDPSVSESKAVEYATLLGSKSGGAYFDLISELPNLVKTEGWLATRDGLTEIQKTDRGARVLAIGWEDDSFADCSDTNGPATSKWTDAQGKSCPVEKTKCYTIHGPYDRDVRGVQKTFVTKEKHDQIKVKFRLWKADSWDNERFIVKVDDAVVLETDTFTADNVPEGFQKVPFCAYEPQGNPNFGHIRYGTFEGVVPHNRDQFKFDISTWRNQHHGIDGRMDDEWFGFDQFEYETISKSASIGGVFNLSNTPTALALQTDIDAKCGPTNNISLHVPNIGPPTKVTGIRANPEKCKADKICTLAAGTIQISWTEPRSWGYKADYNTRTYEIEYSGYVEGKGLVDGGSETTSAVGASAEESSTGSVDDTSEDADVISADDMGTAGDTGTADDTETADDMETADDTAVDNTADMSADMSATDEEGGWPKVFVPDVNGTLTCLKCFIHKGKL